MFQLVSFKNTCVYSFLWIGIHWVCRIDTNRSDKILMHHDAPVNRYTPRQWLDAVRQQAITWENGDLDLFPYDIIKPQWVNWHKGNHSFLWDVITQFSSTWMWNYKPYFYVDGISYPCSPLNVAWFTYSRLEKDAHVDCSFDANAWGHGTPMFGLKA